MISFSDKDIGGSPMSHSHTYSGNPLDRGERERRDENWITVMTNDPTSRVSSYE